MAVIEQAEQHTSAPAGLPPGPGWGMAIETLATWAAPAPFLRWNRRRYGRAFTLRVAPIGTCVWVTEPEDVKAVFTADPAIVHAGEANALLGPVLGEQSVLLLDDEEHLRRRKLMLPMFHGEAVRAYAELMAEVAAEEIATWKPGVMRLHPRMQSLTLEIIIRAVLGVDAAHADRLRVVLRDVIDITPLRMLLWIAPRLERVGPWKRYRAVQADADALLMEIIAARRADPAVAQRTDILSLLVQATYEDGSALTDRDVRDQLMTLLLAGHETTATGLAWAFERLMRHPEHLRRAVAAADAGDDDHLDLVAKETLRVRQVILDVARKLTRDAEFGGRLLPAGTVVFPSIMCVQEGDAWGPDALAFDPGRWERGPAPPYAWVPFGGGTRRCLGAAFAQMELRIVLREVLRRVELRPVLRRDEKERVRHVSSIPSMGALARVRRRTVNG
jgi:cytochrome P450